MANPVNEIHSPYMMEQAQRDNAHIMQMVVHDLRDSIGAIKSVATLLLEEKESIENPNDFIALIKTSSSNLLEMVSDILYINTIPLKKEAVNMEELLRYSIDLLKFKAVQKNQQISLISTGITIETDKAKMWRVLNNLISNAIKFSPVNSDIKVEMYKNEKCVQILVKDQGIGIPDILKNKVFDVYSKSKKRTGTQGEKSFGIGLSISKQMVELLGGKIWFESDEGKGTVFYVEFPENVVVTEELTSPLHEPCACF